MGSVQVAMRESVKAPMAEVFSFLTDHEGMHRWPGVSAARLIREGTSRNGLGAIRAIKARGITLHEEIVGFDEPRGFDYKIIKGLPVDHLGQVRLSEKGELTVIAWEVNMSSRVPFVAQIVGRLLRQGLPHALAFVKAELEAK